jgi:hypothetical protein
MSTVAAEWPWTGTGDAIGCNLALGHLFQNLSHLLTIDGRIHAETYISAVGAIAGYAAQRTLFAEIAPLASNNIHRVGAASGDQYWYGDPLNFMLVPKTNAEANRCVWSIAAGGAMSAGLRELPKLDAMFAHVTSVIGGANEGRSSVAAQHQAGLPARDLLKKVWPLALTCFSGKLAGASHEYPAAPVAWWSAISAWASNRPVRDVKDVLRPDIALTLLMESAIYCSKLDQTKVEGA